MSARDSTVRRGIATSVAWAIALCLLGATTCEAAQRRVRPTIVVARFELVQTAPTDEQYDVAADGRRIDLVSRRVRQAIARSGAYRLLDRDGGDEAPPFSYLSCPACIWDWGHARGADFILVGWVQKQSRLILAVGMLLLDVRKHAVVRASSVQIRNDTDRMWLEAADYLLTNSILVPAAQRGPG